jgi:hypothetical protein
MGLFKKKNGEATKFTKAFANKEGKQSIFSKALNTVLDVVEYIPVAGTAAKAVESGVKVASKVAIKEASKIAIKEAVKVASKTALKEAAKVALSVAQTTAQNVRANQNTGFYNKDEKSTYDYVGAKTSLGDAGTKKPKPVGFFDWLGSLFS